MGVYAKLSDYVSSWYYYFFCKQPELIPLEPRQPIDDEIEALNRIVHHYKRQKLP